MKRIRLRDLLWPIVLLWLASSLWQLGKPLPAGVGEQMPWRTAVNVEFLADLTFTDAAGERHSEQRIFDEMFAMIGRARRQIVIDMFLFNDFAGGPETSLRPLSAELTDALVARLNAVPDLRVLLITDPINTVYGSVDAPQLARLREAGAQVVLTDLDRLRASNPLWSGPWGLCCSWLGNRAGAGWLPNPFGTDDITLRSWLALPNFRANHRKTLVVDDGDGWRALVTSANPHDASSAHGNVALRFSGPAVQDLLASELDVARFSGADITAFPLPESAPMDAREASARLRVLGERAIARALVERIKTAEKADRLDVAVFYLSHRGVMKALKAAHARGVEVRVLLDPNEHAFGRTKNGVPNRQVAGELVGAGVPVRWCDTHGEQCHAKLLLHRGADGGTLIAGSANFTRRNLDNLNLELSVQLEAPLDHPAIRDAGDWFEQAWSNTPERRFSVPYEQYMDDSLAHRLWYWIGETAGLSTW